MSANSGFETFANQAPNSVFSMAHLDIPTYNVGSGSNDNSAHTTPLNYMRRSTPVSAIRRVEQIKERDPFTGFDEDSERDLDSKLDLMKLSSANATDFFQLRDQRESELQELEPSTGELPHESRNSGCYHEDNLMMRYNNGSAQGPDGNEQVSTLHHGLPVMTTLTGSQFFHFQNCCLPADRYYGSEHSLGRNDHHEQSVARHGPQPSSMAAQVGFTASNLVMPPQDTFADNDALYFVASDRRPPTYGGNNTVTPRATWNPSPTNRGHLASTIPGGSQQQVPPQYPVRRGGPASPSMLSSYATASAQPHLTPKFVGQASPQHQHQQPYPTQYGQEQRPPQREDVSRYPPADRAGPGAGYHNHAASPRHGAGPVPGALQYAQAPPSQGPPQGQSYYGAPYQGSAQAGHGLQYPMQPQTRGGGAYSSAPQSSIASYYNSQSLPPVQPDYIFQVWVQCIRLLRRSEY